MKDTAACSPEKLLAEWPGQARGQGDVLMKKRWYTGLVR